VAKQALDEMNLDRAQVELEEYLKARPQDSGAELLAAQTARRRGDLSAFDHHLQAYEKTKDLNGDGPSHLIIGSHSLNPDYSPPFALSIWENLGLRTKPTAAVR
jgi:hypothetical protein